MSQVLPPQPPSLCSTSGKFRPEQTSVSSTEQNKSKEYYINLLWKCHTHRLTLLLCELLYIVGSVEVESS